MTNKTITISEGDLDFLVGWAAGAIRNAGDAEDNARLDTIQVAYVKVKQSSERVAVAAARPLPTHVHLVSRAMGTDEELVGVFGAERDAALVKLGIESSQAVGSIVVWEVQ